jgi:hypothetical protein
MWLAMLALALGGCGSSSHEPSASNRGAPLSLRQVEANLKGAGYKISVFSRGEGALQIDATHTASAGMSIDYSPQGQQLYATVYQTIDPAVRAAIISHNSDETRPIVRGPLIFAVSGTASQLQTIVKDAADSP